MPYMIRALVKLRDLGDTKPVKHTFFTSDELDPATAKAAFEKDQPGAKNVELFQTDKPCKPTDFDRLMAAAEPEEKIVYVAPAAVAVAPVAHEAAPAAAPKAG